VKTCNMFLFDRIRETSSVVAVHFDMIFTHATAAVYVTSSIVDDKNSLDNMRSVCVCTVMHDVYSTRYFSKYLVFVIGHVRSILVRARSSSIVQNSMNNILQVKHK
jgi:hypothetical protein